MARCLARNAAADLPAHDVSPLQGAFLALMVRISGARRVLEVGTLGGISTIWMARALPEGGEVVTLEVNPAHAAVARANLAAAGVDGRVRLIEGRAIDSLAALEGPFDLVFLDADKPSNPDYLRAVLPLCRAGAVIIADNVVREGRVVTGGDASSDGVRAMVDAMAELPLEATALQTVGVKGWDGFVLMRVGAA